MMAPDAGKADFGGPKEREGTKGYAADDLPLRDGHNEEPDVPATPDAKNLGDADAQPPEESAADS